MLLGIHLCGTLALRAIELFNIYPTALFLALKPCCLPTPNSTTKEGRPSKKAVTIWTLGGHTISSADVAREGKYVSKSKSKSNGGGKWQGRPKAHLSKKFDCWANHLLGTIHVGAEGRKSLEDIEVGHPASLREADPEEWKISHLYQTKFLFASKPPGAELSPELSLRTIETKVKGNQGVNATMVAGRRNSKSSEDEAK